jgi:hypothetical protein
MHVIPAMLFMESIHVMPPMLFMDLMHVMPVYRVGLLS